MYPEVKGESKIRMNGYLASHHEKYFNINGAVRITNTTLKK
jgi:hypothetical protein